MSELKSFLSTVNRYVDKALHKEFASYSNRSILKRAIEYSLFSGGKRFRPALLLATSRMFKVKDTVALIPACAIELIHTFTLIHDDLPCMDNSDYRRGKKTVHNVYGEAVAVLVGDALLNHAFGMLALDSGPYKTLSAQIKLNIIRELSCALGMNGVVKGQVDEMTSRGTTISVRKVDDIYRQKTGALIDVSLKIGGVLGNASRKQLNELDVYGQHLGVAFQIQDDIIEWNTGESRKRKNEPNYVRLTSLKKAITAVQKHVVLAKKSISCFNSRARLLREISDYSLERTQ